MWNVWTGDLVRLRTFEPRDVEVSRAWDEDSEAARLGYYIPFPRGEEAQREWITNVGHRDPSSGNFVWVIETLDGAPIGSINVHGADQRHGTFEYGITIAREFWGKGYAADALRIVLAYYFRELRYAKCDAVVYAYNPRSQAFHKKFGFTLEGQIRSYRYTGGRRHDVFWYGMTAEEFDEKYPERPERAV